MSKAKFSQSGIERQTILNPVAVKLFCRWYGMSVSELYASVSTDPSIVTRVERFASGLRVLKPSVLA
jgi:hypothetical protein